MADESKPTPTSPPPKYTETATSALAQHPPRPTVEDESVEAEQSAAAIKPLLPPRTATQASTSSPFPPRSPTQPSTSASDHMPRKPVPTADPRGPPKPIGSLLQQAKGAMPTSFAGAKDSAMKYGKFVLDHVKKGEMPWTQWYCCGLVNGAECETENHRLHKECKKCGHRVCEKCVKGTLGG
ncbi:uncharacterized protein K444DRAFT_613441 [Hyaloscypha bicolor E]|uniref:Uncharacterized protein n=1 Tax=Hyaloscypha bicolor E TaxID=1095630 RepID=A0A2J6T8Y4_9HELO|nr:uncharacterized protein K444DRAFT_613441 [Hyaloscypha bicolor E]PMD59482.1 hypothetical protein K444DRAFT_613441 [Hyaloscypha bicolor E]